MSQQQKQQQQGRDNKNKGTNFNNKGGNNTNKGASGNNKPQGNQGANKPQGGQGKPQGQQSANKPKVDNGTRSLRFPGIVRSVPSGDTIVILKENGTDEIQLTLLGIKAPLLGKKTKDEVTKDQPFAWESREFLRSLVINKSIVYRVEHEFGNRSYGEAWICKDSANIRFLIAQKGWAEVSVKEKRDKEGAPMELRKEDQELLQLQEAAKAKKLGIWATGGKHIRAVKYHENRKDTDPDALFAFFEKNKNKPLNAVVEQVKTGSTLRVYAPSSSDDFTISLSGVHCPIYRFNDETASEPFSREAKFFTEHCLLNRDVIVTLESMDKINNFFGTVVDAEKKRNVGFNLIKMGLGSFVEWNAPAGVAKEWQEAERDAKEAKLRIWKKWKPTDTKSASSSTSVPAKEFLGTVVEIVNPGLIVVRVQKGEGYVDINVNLSSIRVPRVAVKDNKKKGEEVKEATSEKEKKTQQERIQKAEEEKIQSAYAHVGKEFLRKELIGKKVKVSLDYTSPPYTPPGSNKTLPARSFYSVYVNGKNNIAIRLVQKGLATVAGHQDGDARSPEYKELILAEKAAKQEAQGQHAPKSKAPVIHVNDISNDNEAKNRPYLATLKRFGRLPAVVEYVFSGSRLKVFIPSQQLTISFSLQGVMSDKVVKNDKAKPLPNGQLDYRALYPLTDAKGNAIPANAAFHFGREHLYQRDVEVEIDDIDKFGTFFGTLTYNKTDYLLQLLEAATVKLHQRSAEKLPGYKIYNKIEEASKKTKKGVWHDYDEAEEKRKRDEINAKFDAARAEREQSKQKERIMALTVTEIMTGSTFFFQKATDETKTLMEDLMADLQSRGWDDQPEYSPVEAGEWVVAKFSVDNNWYRAEVLRVINNKGPQQFELRYVDYGNTEVVNSKSIRVLPDDLGEVAAQARKGKLAYIRSPALDDEYGEDAAAFFKELVWGKTLLANIEYTEGEGDNAVYHISLGDEETKTNINGALVIQGLARVESRRQTRIVNKEFYNVLQQEENKAKSGRVCIWQYGTIPDSDEDRQWANMLK